MFAALPSMGLMLVILRRYPVTGSGDEIADPDRP
jgi:hypothetical protein